MKRTISMILAILMLLPMIASMVFAVSTGDVEITDEPKNIADLSEISVTSGLSWGNWDPSALVDGDKEYGTLSPKGHEPSFKLTFDKVYYISEVVVVANGMGEHTDGTEDEVAYDTTGVQIKGYDKKGELIYTSELYDTTNVEEAKFTVGKNVVEIEVIVIPENDSYCSLWEVEAYTKIAPASCDAEQTNIAKDALLNSTVYSTKEEMNVPSSWWAMDLTRLIDGDIHTGTHTVKSSAFSLWFYFGTERLMSEIVVHTNGNGALAPTTGLHTKNFEDAQGQPLGEGVDYFTAYQLTVVLYDFNDEVVYESEVVDVSGLTEFVAQAGVNAATVELKISNAGGAGQGGGVYMWDVEIFEETGSHIYEEYNRIVPGCGQVGYRQYQCQDPTCAMQKVETIPATGFHTWNEGVVTNDPTETANGTKTYTCIDCGSALKRDVAALGHNWDNGTVVEPDCDEGYTEYKCTDPGCNLSYRDSFVDGIGHKYNDGIITKRATTEEKGLLTFTCQREGCGYKETKELREAKYIDSTFKVDQSIVKYINASHYQELAQYVFDGKIDDGNFWCAPGERKSLGKDENGKEIEERNSGTVELILDKEYYFTKGTIYVYSNYNWMEVHFMYQDENGQWQTSATFRHDRIQADQVTGVDMTTSLNQGARASKIVIESVSAKTRWDIPQYTGSGLQFHEIELEAHKCDLQPEDYEPRENWKMPTCSKAGSCKATCPVCTSVSTVVLDSATYAHSYGEVSVSNDPTCATAGKGTKICSECSYVATVEIAPTGEHVYSSDNVYIEPDCIHTGIGQKVCATCGDVDYNYAIKPTGEHIYKYTTKSEANYTAVGRDVYACQYCQLQGDKEDIIADKLEIPENFVTFKGYSVRFTGYVGLRASFQFDEEILKELQKTCDVTITIYAKNMETGDVVSAQAYGKKVHYSNTEKFNENNEFSAVAKVAGCNVEYEFSYEIKLVNMRGTETKTVVVPGYTNGKTTTTVKEVAKDAINAPTIKADVKALLQEIIAE